MAAVCPGGSTVLATVMIVVKHGACLSARSVAQAIGVTAQSLSGLFRRRISTVSCLFRSQSYQYNSCLVYKS
jgi:hypothetical protein